MKITKLNCYTYEAPFNTPIKSNLITMHSRKVLVVGMVIDEQEYFAEINSFETPWYHYETIDIVFEKVIQIFHQIKGKVISNIDSLYRYLDMKYPNASSCFDVVYYQYTHALKPLMIPIGQTLHHDATHIHPDAARVKLKMHQNIVQQVQSIRAQSSVQIVIDANGLLDASHFQLLNSLSQYHIQYIEQPFRKLNHYEAMHRAFPHVPLAIDESATDMQAIHNHYEVGVKTAVIKYCRLGGVTRALQLQTAFPDMQFVSGGMYEFGVSKYYTAMLGAQFKTVPDVTPKGTYFNDDYSLYDESIIDAQLHLSVPKVNRDRLTLIASYA
ncbi:enolase C-terminal domain-like protein [Macrococcus capreoli]|uniref:enolase C-terminal domain-like protein n=1 Tax=Macrococcus capreoli TaxID=2982690 RepID=UPI0021D5A818|nr:enolase C-terminal domain-like protein [Macrococcus sp. TMW 2.2395]MCU7557232.1 hypothetical protein [Macrococcus sp. TMW 2.2395]